MVGVPAAIPVTTPVLLTVPIAGVLLVQVPPVVPIASAVVEFTHTDAVPVMAGTAPFTVTFDMVLQPAARV